MCINDFCEPALSQPFLAFISVNFSEGRPLSSYKEYVSMFLNMHHPEAFGQHPNADKMSQIQETHLFFDILLSLHT